MRDDQPITVFGQCLPASRGPVGRRCQICYFPAIAATSLGAMEGLLDHLTASHPDTPGIATHLDILGVAIAETPR